MQGEPGEPFFSESAGGLGMSTCFIEWITMTIKHGPLFFWNQTIGEDALEVFNKKSWNKYGYGNAGLYRANVIVQPGWCLEKVTSFG